uniref:DUF5899 domain-containing protein n=1 Tax=viral metagenome TaxID=1070528 RepID=A0A6C0K0Q8_9ZZZZ
MEIAIPILALGGLYVASNQGAPSKKNIRSKMEQFTSMGAKRNYLPNTNTPPQNYPVPNESEITDTVQKYANPNAASDKYFDQNLYEKKQNSGAYVGNNIQQVYSLTGDYVAKTDFKHNNMIPFYGGKIKGQVYNNNNAETILDNMIGSGSQVIKKIEQAPLFKPQDNMQWAHGAPNSSDFYQSRVNPGMKISNVKPFETEYVGPGLNQGYTTQGSGGYNSGMESRDSWLPKTVDELRVATNPKMEYTLENHQGPSYSHVQNVGIIGKVEKYNPDTFFIQTQDRWLTTTGQEKGQMLRPIEEVHSTTRASTTQSYTGVAGPADRVANYVPGSYEEAKRNELPMCDVGPSAAMNRGDHADKDNALKSHTNYVNNRSTMRQPDSIRSGFGRAIGAVIAPLMDAFNPTRREEYSGNYRIYGDAGSRVPDSYVLNPNDVAPTTIKETTLYTPRSYIGRQIEGGGYQTNEQTPISNQRDTTNCSYIGDAGGSATGWGEMSYASAYAQHNNESKEKSVVSRTNHGNTNIYNQQMNVNVARIDGDRDNTRMWVPTNMPQMPMSKETYGKIRAPQYYNQCIGCDRISPDILNAFKENPYTHSLTSSV